MNLSLIAALTTTRVIGNRGHMPWHMPADLKHFKKLTLHKTVIMGRKTFDSIGKPLPERHNIIITRNSEFVAPHCEITHSLAQAIDLATTENPHQEIMVIGGAEIFKEALDQANRMYLTFIYADLPGDAFFPSWDPMQWKEIKRLNFRADEKNPHDYSFVTFEKYFSGSSGLR